MIRFSCKNCGQRFKVADIDAGKKAKCPKCKNIIIIPTQPTDSYDFFDKSFESIQVKERAETDKAEAVTERKLPWIIDIFLYPKSTPGLTNLGIFIVLSTLLDILALVLGFLVMFLGFAIGAYICWYFAECVRDSAEGRTRAPELFAIVDVGEMLWQTLHLAGCYLVFLGPPAFYFLFTHKTNAVFWLLLTYGVFFFPMGLLAVVMFKSDSALNPILLIRSIFSTFFQCCGLVLFGGVFVLIVYAINQIQPDNWGARVLGFITSCVLIYLALVIAHLLGRFYWKYQEKLNWEV